MRRAMSITLGLGMGLLSSCAKHDCDLDDKQAHYFEEIALTTKGAKKCLASVTPYGCDLEADRCTPTLNALHGDTTQEQMEEHYKAALTGQGWTFVGEKASEDGSKILAFSKGDRDELMVAFGTSAMSKAMAGDSSVDVFMTRKPDKATGTMLDEYKKDAGDEKAGDAEGEGQ
jgi:hypothetical protein